MNEFTLYEGALLAFLVVAPLALLVTALLRNGRNPVALAGSDRQRLPLLDQSYEELDQPLQAMQRQVDVLSRAQMAVEDEQATATIVAQLEAEISEAANWIADLLDDRDRRLASEDRLRSRLESMSVELDRLRADRKAILLRSEELTAELARVRDDVVRLSEMLERSETEKRALEDQLGQLAPRMAELMRLLGELTTERDGLRRQLSVAQGTLSEHHRATEAAERALETALQGAPIEAVRSVEDDLRQLRTMESERVQRVHAVAKRLHGIDVESSAVRRRLAVGRPVVDRLQEQLSHTKASAQDISQALNNARHRIERLHRSTRPRHFV